MEVVIEKLIPGGAQFMPYDIQVQTKEDFCGEVLLRQGRLETRELPAFTIFKSRPTGYRSRTRPIIQNSGTPAFRESGSHSNVLLNHCPIAVREINQFPAHPPELKPGGEPVVFGDEEHFRVQSLDNLAVIELAGKKSEFPPGAFFQSNSGILPDMLNHLMKDLEGDFALDLYGGVGLFGLGSSVRRLLCTLRAPKLVYLLCDPVTRAGDLNELLGAGCNLSSYALADFYPQTPNVETIAILKRDGK